MTKNPALEPNCTQQYVTWFTPYVNKDSIFIKQSNIVNISAFSNI